MIGHCQLIERLASARLVCDTRLMSTPPTPRSKHPRFPAEIIRHGLWLYDRCCRRYRDGEELRFVRGVIVAYEAIRKGCRTFGRQ
jgi:putative transposase